MKGQHRVLSLLAWLALCLLLVGCEQESYTIENYTMDEGVDYWTASYETFDGNMIRELEVSGAGEHAFTIETVTESGTIGVEMRGIDGIRYYEGEDLGTETVVLYTDGPGRFVFEVIAEDHSGSFSIRGA